MTGLRIGPCERLIDTYTAMQDGIGEPGLAPASKMGETYLSDPGAEKDPATLATRLSRPVAQGQAGGTSF